LQRNGYFGEPIRGQRSFLFSWLSLAPRAILFVFATIEQWQPLRLPSVSRFRNASKAELLEVLTGMILLATEQLEQSKRIALQVADIMNLCRDLIRKSQAVHDSLEALLKRLTAADASTNVIAFPSRIFV
jgi:hypothetical protein